MMSELFGLSEKYILNIQKIFVTFPEIEKAVIFGSRALGNYKTGSDIDIALQGQSITDEIVIKLSGILNEETMIPYFFDILNYNSISNDELKKHIDINGKSLYEKNLSV